MAEFNLNELFRNSFGYEAPASFSIEQAPAKKELSNLGQRYYAEDLSGREFFLPVWINGQLIPFAVLGVTCKKTIVSTPMPERSGSVHELISIDDYSFTLKGLLVNESNEFPEQDIADIHNLFLVNASVSMRSALSDIFLSGEFDHKVIIQDVNWPPSPGVEHVKAFEIKLVSDQIFELTID